MSTLPVFPDSAAEKPVSPQDQKRCQILAAARRCFSKSGFHRASMQEICAEAKMSPGALYRYFRSKDEIIEAIAEEERQEAQTTMALLDGPGPLGERLIACGLRYVASMRDHDRVRLMLDVMVESMRNSAIGQRFAIADCNIQERFRMLLTAAKERGEIAADVDIETAAMAMIAVADGIVLRMGFDPSLGMDRVEIILRRSLSGILGLSGRGDAEKS